MDMGEDLDLLLASTFLGLDYVKRELGFGISNSALRLQKLAFASWPGLLALVSPALRLSRVACRKLNQFKKA